VWKKFFTHSGSKLGLLGKSFPLLEELTGFQPYDKEKGKGGVNSSLLFSFQLKLTSLFVIGINSCRKGG
jgi:hypothetical protein